MDLRHTIAIGENLDIRIGMIATKAKIESILDEKRFLITQPTFRLVPLFFKGDEVVQFSFVRPNGFFSFSASFQERLKRDNFTLCRFAAITDIEQKQRRYAYRLPVILDATVKAHREADKDELTSYEARVRNLSEEGVYFSCFTPFDVGTSFLFDLRFSQTRTLLLKAQVVRCEQPENRNDPYMMAARFVDLSKNDQARIAKFILQRQVQDRKLMLRPND